MSDRPSSSSPTTGTELWPLVVFTTLAILGAGLLAAPLLALLVEPTSLAATRLRLPGVLLLAAGVVVSLAHLGRVRRAPLALAGIGRSRLSAEVALAGLTILASLAALALPLVLATITLVPSAFAIAFLVALGLVYSVPGQHTWRGAVVLSPLILGLGTATVALAGQWEAPGKAFASVALASVAADLAVALLRLETFRHARGAAPVYREWFGHRFALLAVRVVLVDVLAPACLLARFPKAAGGALGLGILVDRLAFYLLAARHTTESEIASAEDAIDGA